MSLHTCLPENTWQLNITPLRYVCEKMTIHMHIAAQDCQPVSCICVCRCGLVQSAARSERPQLQQHREAQVVATQHQHPPPHCRRWCASCQMTRGSARCALMWRVGWGGSVLVVHTVRPCVAILGLYKQVDHATAIPDRYLAVPCPLGDPTFLHGWFVLSVGLLLCKRKQTSS